MSRPRLAYLYSRYPVVSQTFCDSEMLALEGMGFDLEVVSLNPPPDSFRHERLDRLRAELHYPAPDAVLEAQAKQPGFEAALGALITDHDTRYGKAFKSRTRARNAWHFAPRLRTLGVTHVHVHFANRATHSALFLKKLGFTFSFTAHAQDFMVDLGSDDLLREMVRESEFVIAVSDFSRQLLVDTCPGNDARSHRIYNGIELDDFPRAEPAREGPLRLVSVGRLIEFKGFQHLIPAMGKLKERGLALELRIIGEGPSREALETQIMQAGLQDEVKLLGVRSQDQIKRELAEAHVFVLPSIVDSKGASDILPTVITEAMACGLPVVSTTVAGIPEMVLHGVTGLLVEPKDEAAMTEALATLAADPAMRARMGAAAVPRAQEIFALSVTAGRLGERFRDVVKKHAAPRIEPPIAYVLNESSEVLSSIASLAREERLRVIASRAVEAGEVAEAGLFERLEWLPDAVVLESLWLRRASWRQQIERLRATLGDAVDGEDFYRQARRAVWLAEMLPKRGVRLLHACRAEAVVCVWLVKHLTGLKASAAIEDAPALSRQALVKMLDRFDLVNVSDEKLRGMLPALGADVLNLRQPPTHRKLTLGPVKLKLRHHAPAEDRSGVEQAWFQKLLSLSLP